MALHARILHQMKDMYGVPLPVDLRHLVDL
jgi:hypothetical protein